jgi:hypothetical protein
MSSLGFYFNSLNCENNLTKLTTVLFSHKTEMGSDTLLSRFFYLQVSDHVTDISDVTRYLLA